MEVKKILWPTDLSANSARALGLVTEYSRQYGAEVHLLYVVEDVKKFDHLYGDANQKLLTKLQEAESEFAEKWMNKVCDQDLMGCPAYFRHLVIGDPAEEIVKMVKKVAADIVIMATHGRGNEVRGEDAFGAVADKVVKNSPVPVLTVPPEG